MDDEQLIAGNVAAAMPSPLDTPTVSGEDDDYRSETSSETHDHGYIGSGGFVGVKRYRQPPAASSYSNHRDLSLRLRRAAVGVIGSESSNGGGTGGLTAFAEGLIGADVVLCVAAGKKRDGARRFHAHRFMLAASSEPFRAMLTGRMREASERDVEIRGVEPSVVEKMLIFIYTGDVTVDLESVVGLLIAAEMYELEALREICKSFVLYHAHEVFRDPQIVELPEKLLLEIIEHDELQIREIPLLEALVGWGQARVDSSDRTPVVDILGDVMEHVRFGTMSVSDLYGKVRPLVRDGIVRESLLTEALFHHLKWGTPSGRASQRMKPRALAAALRKRKRVSFIQHVSFHDERPNADE